MKLTVDLSSLWSNVTKMGAPEVSFDLGRVWSDSELDFDDLLSSSGIEVNLDELESEEGLLSVRGRQVLLFIPDHGMRFEKTMLEPKAGNKFHVADCLTLDTMRRRNSFERYKVTNNGSSIFSIFGYSQFKEHLEGKAKLHVCKNCINQLNYKGVANASTTVRDQVVDEFDLEEFFTTYSSLFKKLPRHHANEATKGYSKNWSDISKKIREKSHYICQYCNVDLSSDKKLLHVHHRNREKSDNSTSNLIALCADCHRKEPFHGHMYVEHEDTQRINQLRKEQNVLTEEDWSSVKQKADPAVHGVIEHCLLKGYSIPEVAYPLRDDNSGKEALLELAWAKRRFGIVLNTPVAIEGWDILTLSEALEFFGGSKTRGRV